MCLSISGVRMGSLSDRSRLAGKYYQDACTYYFALLLRFRLYVQMCPLVTCLAVQASTSHCLGPFSHHLLPYIRKQIITSPTEPSSWLRSCSRMCSSSRSRRRRRTAPSTKVIVLCNCRRTPSRTLWRRVSSGSSCGGLTRRRRSPHIIATPCVHVGEASAVVGLCWGGLSLRRRC
jgi:hypothetical protein